MLATNVTNDTLVESLFLSNDQTYIYWTTAAVTVAFIVTVGSLASVYWLWVDRIYRLFVEVFVIFSLHSGLLTIITIIPNSCFGRLVCVRALYSFSVMAILVTSYIRNVVVTKPFAGQTVNMWTIRTGAIVLFLFDYAFNVGTVHWDEDHPYLQSCKGMEVNLKLDFEEDPKAFVLRVGFLVINFIALFSAISFDISTICKIVQSNSTNLEKEAMQRLRSYSLPLVTAILSPLSVVINFAVLANLLKSELISISHLDKILNIAAMFYVSFTLALLVWGTKISDIIIVYRRQRARLRADQARQQYIEMCENPRRLRPLAGELIELQQLADPEPERNQQQSQIECEAEIQIGSKGSQNDHQSLRPMKGKLIEPQHNPREHHHDSEPDKKKQIQVQAVADVHWNPSNPDQKPCQQDYLSDPHEHSIENDPDSEPYLLNKLFES